MKTIKNIIKRIKDEISLWVKPIDDLDSKDRRERYQDRDSI